MVVLRAAKSLKAAKLQWNPRDQMAEYLADR